MKEFKALYIIVNAGFSEVAMDEAKRLGARGGTIMHGRGTAPKEADPCAEIYLFPKRRVRRRQPDVEL